MYKALVIGCGNIGALYDLHSMQIQTHAKAFANSKDFQLHLFDKNPLVLKRIAAKYNCAILNKITKNILKEFDIVSICTPTRQHYKYLIDSIDAGVKVLICEKPISLNKKELMALKKKYRNGNTKILVNYFRSFQPSFIKLKSDVEQILHSEKLYYINIKYRRGFLNNASHAFDLLNTLFSKTTSINNFTSLFNRRIPDLINDPSIDFYCLWNLIPMRGIITDPSPLPVFEIELIFTSSLIKIDESGNRIVISKVKNKGHNQTITTTAKVNCINNYMIPVVKEAKMLLLDSKRKENFIESLNLNLTLLKHS